MGSNSCFSEIIADVFPPWHRVNTHLDAAEQQYDKTSPLLIPVEAIGVYFVF